jgi:hypothetical protein
MLAYCVQSGQQQDAAEFLDLYLEALDEELVAPCTYTSTHKSASAPGVEEREDETQSAEGQTEERRREYMVRQSFILTLH